MWHCMYVRAYVCVKSPPFSGGGEVFGFVGGALEDFSGGPSHSAESQIFKKNHSLLNQMSFLFLKGQLKTNLRQKHKNKNLISFFPCPFVLFVPGGRGWGGACWCWCWVGIDLAGDFGVGVGDLAIYKKKGSHNLHQGAAIYC